MKKRNGIIVAIILIILAGVSFVYFAFFYNSSNNKNYSNKDSTDIEIEDNGEIENSKYYNITTISNFDIFQDETLDLTEYISIFPSEGSWSVNVTSESESIEIDEANYKIKGKDVSDTNSVTISISPLFDTSIYKDYKNKTFPETKTFNICVLPNMIDLEYNLESTDVNNFKLTLSCSNYKLLRKNVNVKSSSEDFDYFMNESSGTIKFTDLSLKKYCPRTLSIEYVLENYKNEKRVIASKDILITPATEFVNCDWFDNAVFDSTKNLYKLYVTKNSEYNKNHPNYATIFVNDKSNLKVQNCYFQINEKSEDSGCLTIDSSSLKVLATKCGSAIIDLYVCGALYKTFNFVVLDVPIEINDVANENLTANVGESVDVTLSDEKISPAYAIYEIKYNFTSNLIGATLDSNHKVSSLISGQCVIEVSVREFTKTITITFEKNGTNEFKIINNETNEVLDELVYNYDVSLDKSDENQIFYDAKIVKFNNSSYNECKVTPQIDNDWCECSLTNKLGTNDEFDLNITLYLSKLSKEDIITITFNLVLSNNDTISFDLTISFT